MGAGGHARVCIEALEDDPDNRVLGCISREGASEGRAAPIVGSDADLERVAAKLRATHVFVAIGDNHRRAMLTERCTDAGLRLVSAISRFAHVSPTAEIGGGVALLPGSLVNAAAVVHDGVVLNTNAAIDHDCVVGAFSHLAPAATIAGEVTVGREVLIGIGAKVIPGVSIGDRAVIGAGSVVVHDVPSGMTVVGTPARPIKRSARRA